MLSILTCKRKYIVLLKTEINIKTYYYKSFEISTKKVRSYIFDAIYLIILLCY